MLGQSGLDTLIRLLTDEAGAGAAPPAGVDAVLSARVTISTRASAG